MTDDERQEWAEDHGYVRYRHNFGCGRIYYSDSGPGCPYCWPDPAAEEEEAGDV